MQSILNKTIPLTKVSLGSEEEEAVREVLRSGWLTQGPKVEEFEKKVAEYVGARYAVATSSCTTALHLALLTIGVKDGDEVILPSFTFIATANAVLYCAAKPVFVDIDSKTYNIDPSRIEEAITPKTKVIMPVHQVGLPAEMDAILSIAKRYNLYVVEDAACALGAQYRDQKIGLPHGDLACFSFHPRKIITTGEGGMITTNKPEYDKKLRMLRHQGMSVSDLERHQADKIIAEGYPMVGFNYKMTDIQAAIGIKQLEKLDGIITARRGLVSYYNGKLKEIEWLLSPHIPDYTNPTFQSYMVRLTEKAPMSREKLMAILLENKIKTRRGIMAVHKEKPYIQLADKANLGETERATEQCLILPLYSGMMVDEIDYVVDVLKGCHE